MRRRKSHPLELSPLLPHGSLNTDVLPGAIVVIDGTSGALGAASHVHGDTLWAACLTVDFMLLVIITVCWTGSGLLLVNNIGQIAPSLGAKANGQVCIACYTPGSVFREWPIPPHNVSAVSCMSMWAATLKSVMTMAF